MNKPLSLSVIVPNYNHGKFLRACLDSILCQTERPREIIILDDCSTDNSMSIIGDYADCHTIIRVIKGLKNEGVNARMNQGLALARGELIYFCAADDILLPDCFSKAVAMLELYPQAGICFSDPASFTENSDGKTIKNNSQNLSLVPVYFPPTELAILASKKKVLISGMSVMRKDSVVALGGFDPLLKWHSDYFLTYSLAFKYGACYIPEKLNLWRVTDSSYMTKGILDSKQQNEIIARIMNKLSVNQSNKFFKQSAVLAFIPSITKWLILHRQWKWINISLLKRGLLLEIFMLLPKTIQKLIRQLLSQKTQTI